MSSKPKQSFEVLNLTTMNIVKSKQARRRVNAKGQPVINIIDNTEKFRPVGDEYLDLNEGQVYVKKNLTNAIAQSLVSVNLVIDSTGQPINLLYNPSTYKLVNNTNPNQRKVEKATYLDYVVLDDDWAMIGSDKMYDFFKKIWDYVSGCKNKDIRIHLKRDGVGDLIDEKFKNVSELLMYLEHFTSFHKMLGEIQYAWYTSALFLWESELLGEPNNLPPYPVIPKRKFSILVTFPTNDLIVKKLDQVYQDSRDGQCLLGPIIAKFESNLDRAEGKEYPNKKVISNFKSIVKKLHIWRDSRFAHGVPECDIQSIVDELNITIAISDLVDNVRIKYVPETGDSKLRFNYVNTRVGHVEVLSCSKMKYEVTRDQMTEVKLEYDRLGKDYYYMGDSVLPSLIETLEGSYKLHDEVHDLYDELGRYTGLDKSYWVDLIQEPMLCKYIKSADHNFKNFSFVDTDLFKDKVLEPITGKLLAGATYDGLELTPKDNEMDMEKAFLQYRKCQYYKGLMGNITDMRKIDIELSKEEQNSFLSRNVGIYTIDVTKCDHQHLIRMGVEVGRRYELFSPIIEFFSAQGVEFNLMYGCWGTTLDFSLFEFDELCLKEQNMLPSIVNDRHPKGVKYYAHWVGRLALESRTSDKFIKGSAEFAGHLQGLYDSVEKPGEVTHYREDQNLVGSREIISIKNPKKSHRYHPHVNLSIKGYCAIQMMEEALKFDLDQLLLFKTDCIVFRGRDMTTNPLFRDKGDREWVGLAWSSQWIEESQLIDYDFFQGRVSTCRFYDMGKTYLSIGQGGCGKTFDPLTDQGLRHLNFSTLMHRLIAEKKKENPAISISTVYKLVGAECTSYIIDYGYPPVILIDEMTMLDRLQIKKLVKLYMGHSKLIFAGDVTEEGYYMQCPPFLPNTSKLTTRDYVSESDYIAPIGISCIDRGINLDEDLPIVFTFLKYETDYRSKCEILKKLKLDLRSLMVLTYNLSHREQIRQLKEFMYGKIDELKLYTLSQERISEVYTGNDVILASTNPMCQDYTDQTKHIAKHYVIESHTQGDVMRRAENKESYLTGEIYDHEVPRSKLRNCFTIHSYQGMTIKSPSRLYFDMRLIHDPTLIYTAISRAEYLSQLVFILEGSKPKIKIKLYDPKPN